MATARTSSVLAETAVASNAISSDSILNSNFLMDPAVSTDMPLSVIRFKQFTCALARLERQKDSD